MQLTTLLRLRKLVGQAYSQLNLFAGDGFMVLDTKLDSSANVVVYVSIPKYRAGAGKDIFKIVLPESIAAGFQESGFDAAFLACLTDQFVAAIPEDVLPKCLRATRDWASRMQIAVSQPTPQPAVNYRDRSKEILRQLLLDYKAHADPRTWRDPTSEELDTLVVIFPRILTDASQDLWKDVLPAKVYQDDIPLTEQEMQAVEDHVSHRTLRIVRQGV